MARYSSRSENYRDKNVSSLLENMIQDTQYTIVHNFSEKWHVNEDELSYVVANYNSKKKSKVERTN